jgi:anti-sigma factor RsiW
VSKDFREPDAVADLAPFYVVGALSPIEKARFEAALARDPELARKIAAAQAERDEVLKLEEDSFTEASRFDAILALGGSLPAPTRRALKSLRDKMRGDPETHIAGRRRDPRAALEKMASRNRFDWAAAVACLLVALAVAVMLLQNPRDSSRSRDQTTPGVFARVVFAPEASAEGIAKLLSEEGVEVVEGTGARVYRIRLRGAGASTAEAQARLERLRRASPLVRSVEAEP